MKVSFIGGAAYLALQMALGTPVLGAAAQNTNTQNTKSKSQASNATAQTAKQMSQLATRLLQRVDEARHAISSNLKPAAVKHIDQALADQNQLASLAKSKGLAMIVPLYSEFDETSTLAPLIAAKKGSQQQSNQQPNKSTGANQMTPITVEQASGQFTFVGLDLDKAKRRLEAAKTALNNGNNEAAADALSAVETDLVTETETTSFPLLAARENLGIAETAIKNGHIKEAGAALKEASKDLDTYASGNPAVHADDAKNLSKTVDAYSQTVTQNQNHSGAVSKIDGWWHEVDKWFEQPAHSNG